MAYLESLFLLEQTNNSDLLDVNVKMKETKLCFLFFLFLIDYIKIEYVSWQ